MSDNTQLSQVYSYRQELTIKEARRAPLPIDVEPEDPSSWPYSDRTGPPYTDPQDGHRERGFSADPIDMADFTVGPREILCTKCYLIHRPGVECS